MPLRNYLLFLLLAGLVSFWWIDRSRSFDRGKEECQTSHQEAADEYYRRQAEQHKKDVDRAVTEALNARDVITEIYNDKPRVVEKIREITIPASCAAPDSFVREFNSAKDSLSRKH